MPGPPGAAASASARPGPSAAAARQPPARAFRERLPRSPGPLVFLENARTRATTSRGAPAGRRLYSPWALLHPPPLVLDLGRPGTECPHPPLPRLRLTPAFALVPGEEPLGQHARFGHPEGPHHRPGSEPSGAGTPERRRQGTSAPRGAPGLPAWRVGWVCTGVSGRPAGSCPPAFPSLQDPSHCFPSCAWQRSAKAPPKSGAPAPRPPASRCARSRQAPGDSGRPAAGCLSLGAFEAAGQRKCEALQSALPRVSRKARPGCPLPLLRPAPAA